MSCYGDSLPVRLVDASGNEIVINVDGSINVIVSGGRVTTSTVTRVPSLISSHTLVVNNSNRLALAFYNDSTGAQYIKMGTIASQIDFTVRLSAHEYYEMPSPIYSGNIDFYSETTNGAIQVTEYT